MHNPAPKVMKKAGYGTGNWGAHSNEISEGIEMVHNGEPGRGSATAADLGMSKLSTSASSTSSAESFSSKIDADQSSLSSSIASMDGPKGSII